MLKKLDRIVGHVNYIHYVCKIFLLMIEFVISYMVQLENIKTLNNMRIEEIGMKIQRLKYDTEVLKAEIEKVNSHTRRMTRELQAATRQINQLPTLLEPSVPVVSQKEIDKKLKNPKYKFSDSVLELFEVDSYRIGLYTIDVKSKTLIFKDEAYRLTHKEFLVLIIFAANLNNFIDRETFLKAVWNENNYRNSRSMDVYLCKIRKLLSEDKNIHLVNIHAKGFRLYVAPVK
ncbi:MAG: winged helix-turn-helix domain-containing protein [Paludibacter sp.]|nr:winged helix-turn-helix domain-containing protein [Paludibacter sp.]